MRTPFVIALALAVLPTAASAATPQVCRPKAITAKLIDQGKLTGNDADLGRTVAQVRCKDVTGDGRRDALFSVASGGTAGATNWGVIAGRSGGAPGRLVIWRDGYKIALAVTRGDPEILQPVYATDDPNCCPSSFQITRYHYARKRFRVRSTRRTTTAPERFRA